MKLLRNPEVSKAFYLQLVISGVAVFVTFWKYENFGWFVLLLCVFFISVYLANTELRYRKISELASDIDQILHGNDNIDLERYTEGELGILQSELYKLVVRLREHQQQLQNDKVYLADSIADISHQIRTPLTSINLLLSLLDEPDIVPEKRMKLTQELYGLLSRIDWLIVTLLKISRLDAGTVKFSNETVQIGVLLRNAVQPLLIPMELREQTLKVVEKGQFSGDVTWTCEALTNIIKNCMEHTPNGGTIKLQAEENPLYTEIVICDNGTGIDEEDLPHIFERFYKGKHSSNQSFGIGLALTRMIITAQNGTIKVENSVSGGAKFTIRFYKGTV